MKTLRALFWGSAVGLLLGKLFAPRHTDLLRAELAERQGVPEASGASRSRGASSTAAATASTSADAADYRPAGSRSATA